MPGIAFVTARGQSGSPRRLIDALAYELARLEVASVVVDELDAVPADHVALIVGPAAVALAAGDAPPDDSLLGRALCLCSEPADTSFGPARSLTGACAAAFALGRHAVGQLAEARIDAIQLQIGHSEAWGGNDANADRDIDVLYVGAVDRRRARVLAGCAEVLSRWRAHLVLVDASPVNPGDGWPSGAELGRLLTRSRTVLLINAASTPPVFDGVWAAQAAQHGCAMIAEHAVDMLPFRAGEELLAARPASLPDVLDVLLRDERRCLLLGARARNAMREASLATAARQLQVAAESLSGSGGGIPAARPIRVPAIELDPPPRPAPEADPLTVVARGLKDVRGQVRSLERRLQTERIERTTGRPVPAAVLHATSAAWSAAAPRVSVIVPVYEHRWRLPVALDSVRDSSFGDVEVVIVDDGSGDGSADAAAAWLADHPEIAGLIVRHPVNRGLPAARNTAVAFARGQLAFMLDADNQLLAHGLERLVEALDADPLAAFAYGIVQRFDDAGPQGLVSMFPWSPARLRNGNEIDAMALVRVSTLRGLGGYADVAPFTGGWEDYELWCRFAAEGQHGAFVPEIVGRYRVEPGSLLSLTNLSLDDVRDALATRYPGLMGVATG